MPTALEPQPRKAARFFTGGKKCAEGCKVRGHNHGHAPKRTPPAGSPPFAAPAAIGRGTCKEVSSIPPFGTWPGKVTISKWKNGRFESPGKSVDLAVKAPAIGTPNYVAVALRTPFCSELGRRERSGLIDLGTPVHQKP